MNIWTLALLHILTFKYHAADAVCKDSANLLSWHRLRNS